jgi:Fic family protein
LHDSTPLPVLIKVGLAHAQFETIHPFLDGNGRAGRLLITFLLCEQKVLSYPLLYISYYFKKYRSEYYDRLQAVRDRGDWEGWLKFFLRAVAAVAQEAGETAKRIVAMKEQHRQLLEEKMGQRAGKSLMLLGSLYFRPVFAISHVESATGLSYPNANTLVKDLCDLGLLKEITGQKRNRAFAYQPYLEIFQDV